MTSAKTFKYVNSTEFDADFIGAFETGSKEWHDLRESGIGGSDIGTIIGVNPWDSPFALWARRTDQIPQKVVDSWPVRFGNAFEEPILRMWATENPNWELFRAGTYRSRKHPFMLANPDALAQHRQTGEWMVVEVKTSRMTWRDVPPAYQAQVQHYMDVLNIPRAVVVGVVGWNWEERFIDADPFAQEAQRDAARRFWDHLQEHVAPGWDGSKSTYEAVRELHPDIDDEDVDLGELGEELLQAASHADEAEAELNRVRSEVLAKMGMAKTGVVHRDGERVRVASRQARGKGTPWLVIHRERD